ncbi:MAG: hypothetical protein ABEI06_09245 [Halobacteriaceae archaeon]
MVTNTQLYGSSIAIMSGLYSLWGAWASPQISPSGWIMILLGVIVIIHGIILLSGASDYLSGLSGPLMIGYAIIMLLLQVISGSMMETNTEMNPVMDGTMPQATMGWDPGMVALAMLMLISGFIMLQSNEDMESNGM